MLEDGASCPICNRITDEFEDHHVGCGGNGDRIRCHDRDVLFSAAQSATLAPKKEAPALIPNASSRPADVYLPTWERGLPSALDVTVISPLQQQTVDITATTQGHAITVAESRKMTSGPCKRVAVHTVSISSP